MNWDVEIALGNGGYGAEDPSHVLIGTGEAVVVGDEVLRHPEDDDGECCCCEHLAFRDAGPGPADEWGGLDLDPGELEYL